MNSAALLERDPTTYSRFEQFVVEQMNDGAEAQEAVTAFLGSLTALERQTVGYAWNKLWARPSQRLPISTDWVVWFIRAGRGYGKTRTGSEGVRKLVNEGRARAVTIIGPTAADARDVMIEGPDSGLLAVHPNESRPTYEPSKRLLTWPNGTLGHVRSAEEPDGIRGLNSELVWGDEPASWKSGKLAWDNAQLGLRVGKPHAILTGTPRPVDWLKAIEKEATTITTTGSTYENIGNLAPEFIRMILSMYEGTRLGWQELHALYLEDVEGALWTMATIEATRIMAWNQEAPWASLALSQGLDVRRRLGLGAWTPEASDYRRPWETWVAVDPPGETAECGIIVITAPKRAKAGYDHCIVLDDRSLKGTPEEWGSAVVKAVQDYNAVGAAVEKNQGGDMVRSTIHAVNPNVRVDKITSTSSKQDRAEPVSTLHAKGWIHFAGYLPLLEQQLTTWVADESKSPDRLDAFVHAVRKVMNFPGGRGLATVGSPLPGGPTT